jgi:hypothetical protein
MKPSEEAKRAFELWQIVKALEDLLYETYFYDFRAITIKNEFDDNNDGEYNEDV